MTANVFGQMNAVGDPGVDTGQGSGKQKTDPTPACEVLHPLQKGKAILLGPFIVTDNNSGAPGQASHDGQGIRQPGGVGYQDWVRSGRDGYHSIHLDLFFRSGSRLKGKRIHFYPCHSEGRFPPKPEFSPFLSAGSDHARDEKRHSL